MSKPQTPTQSLYNNHAKILLYNILCMSIYGTYIRYVHALQLPNNGLVFTKSGGKSDVVKNFQIQTSFFLVEFSTYTAGNTKFKFWQGFFFKYNVNN